MTDILIRCRQILVVRNYAKLVLLYKTRKMLAI